MKKLFVLFIILFSAQGFAETKNYKCEEDTYILEWHDYDSEWNESCRSFIKDAMKKKNCSEKTLERASNSNVTEIRDGSSLVCIYNGEDGIYQVMASQMAEPHRAVLLFSRLD